MQHSSKILAAFLVLWASFANAQGITPIGGGSGGGSGTVTSIATTCGVSGGTITTTGTISGNATPNAQTGTSYAILDADCGKLLTLSNGSAVAVSIAQSGTAGSFASGWFTTVKNLGAGTVTITPTTSTIDGAANFALTTNQSIDLYSNGTNYITGKGVGGATTDASLLTSGTLAAARLPAFTGDCTVAVGTSATICSQPHPGYVTSNWYLPLGPTGYATTGAATANRITCSYGYFARAITVRNVGVADVAAGTSNTQIALYRSASGKPAALIDSTPSIVNTGAATTLTGALAADQALGPGTANGKDIWLCLNQNDSTITYRGYSASFISGGQYQGSATLGNLLGSGPSTTTGVICSGAACNGGSSTFGTWPATLVGTTWTDQGGTSPIPLVAVQIVSSP